MLSRILRLVGAVPVLMLGGLSSLPCSAQSLDSTLNAEVSYTQDIRPIVKEFCTTCHAGDDPEADLTLTSYDDVRKHVEEGDLLERISDSEDPMPPSGLMPTYTRRLVKLWADQGFVNQGENRASNEGRKMQTFTPPEIQPIDVRRQGFEMLEFLQGHWVGSMDLMGQEFDWMAFDFRPIAPSHVHGLFEGGTIGNLFTSFFVADFKGKQTLMARNGGILNGIYRTSYFVLDDIDEGDDWATYRFVDAYGGEGIMSMELTFRGDTLIFKAFTSRFGLTEPRAHMSFQGRRRHPNLATTAAKAVGFPKNVVDYDFSKGLPKPTWAEDYPMTSASYIWEDTSKGLVELGNLSRDPRRIDQMPYLSQLKVTIKRNEAIQNKKLLIYLSRDALVDQQGHFITRYGYIREELLDTLLLFPELAKTKDEFTFTYLHPGDYYLTVIADMDGDGFPSPGDMTHPRRKVRVKPTSTGEVSIDDLSVKN